MALKFLNKKGWHTGSLRNIENVWKAEQKHDAEQRKLDELRKQIQEERERAEFRLLQERAGLAPRQERLEFLYESGLAVGKGSSEGFKALQAPQKAETSAVASAEPSTSKAAAAPGALFEVEKPQSANDTWRKLHSDPLLLIRQREQEALARIKNNPVQMAMIRKSVEAEKKEREKGDDRKEKKKEKREKKEKKREGRKRRRRRYSSESSQSGDDGEKTRSSDRRSTRLKERRSPSPRPLPPPPPPPPLPPRQSSEWQRGHHRKAAPKLSEEERAARLREMQLDAELHEEQRWKRINKASERDAREAAQGGTGGGKNFLDAARKSMFGTDEGGSATVEESVRRRTYYLQGGGGGAGADEVNAFRRH